MMDMKGKTMAKRVTYKQVVSAYVACGHNKAKTAKDLGVPRSTVYNILKRNSFVVGKEKEPPTVRQVREAERKADTATAEVKQERARRIAAEQDLAELQKATSVLNEIQTIKPVVIKLKTPKHGTKSIATAIYGASDWHAEANVKPDTVNGLNEFTPEICTDRVRRLFQKSVFLTDFARGICDIRDAVLWLGGDLINGAIHDELEISNFLGQAEAISFVSELVAGGIDYLLANGNLDHIRVVCNIGNHGRSTQKTRVSIGWQSSWEYLAYVLLAARYKNEPRLSWIIPKGYFAYVDVQGWDCRFSHGDFIRYSGGVGGITIPVAKAISGWNKSRSADYDFFGHYHQFVNMWGWCCNGSLVGYDGYALSIKSDYQPPTQLFSVIDRERGKTMTLPIFVEEAGYGETK